MISRSVLLALLALGSSAFAQNAVAPGTPPPPPPPDLVPKPAEPQAGPWKSLFDGKTITGLRGLQKSDFLHAGWKIVDGELSLTKEIKQSGRITGGDLMTTEAYDNFELSWAYKLGTSGNSGVLYLARAGLGQQPVGHEFQLIDDVRNPDGLKGGPIKRTGALYGILPPGENKQLNDSGWNHARLIVQGNHVEHWLNDEKVLEYELGSAELKSAVAASKAKVPNGFGMKFKSPILFLDQGEDVAFRNIKIRQLPPK